MGATTTATICTTGNALRASTATKATITSPIGRAKAHGTKRIRNGRAKAHGGIQEAQSYTEKLLPQQPILEAHSASSPQVQMPCRPRLWTQSRYPFEVFSETDVSLASPRDSTEVFEAIQD